MSKSPLDTYLECELMLSQSEDADKSCFIEDLMDSIWYDLSEEDIEWLNARV